MKILAVVGARPNFMKMAPLLEEMGKYPDLQPLLVHTGQHYDRQMSALFFEELGLPRPDIDLGVGSGSHAFQTSEVMRRIEPILLREQPPLVLTDSGGIQEETTVLGVPCLTLRKNTERPVTVTEGTNTLVGSDKEKIVRKGLQALNGHRPGHRIPELWDGEAARRIVAVIAETFRPFRSWERGSPTRSFSSKDIELS